MCSQHSNCTSGPRRRRGRAVVRLDSGGPLGAPGPAGPLPELACPGDRGQPRLRFHAGQREGARPRDASAERMLKALGVDDFNQLFKLEVTDDDP